MKKIILLIAFFKVLHLYAQENKTYLTKNSLHFDCANVIITGMFALNYERFLYGDENATLNMSIGFGRWYLLTSEHTESAFSLPMSINVLIGKIHKLEFDIGSRIVYVDNPVALKKIDYFPIINLGYRFQKLQQGLFFRTFVGSSGLGIGVGYGF